MDGWMDGWMGGWWMDGWMDGWIDGRMDGWWIDGWMDGFLEAPMGVNCQRLPLQHGKARGQSSPSPFYLPTDNVSWKRAHLNQNLGTNYLSR